MVLFTAFFDLIFINIYKPFSSLTWYPVSEFKFFLFSSLVILTGLLTVAISRVIMYFYTKKHALNCIEYGIWIVLEIFFLSTFYTVYSCVLRPEREVMETFWEASENTSLILLLPYAILMLYFSWRDKEQKLQRPSPRPPVCGAAGSADRAKGSAHCIPPCRQSVSVQAGTACAQSGKASD